jgi:hypothetical protein
MLTAYGRNLAGAIIVWNVVFLMTWLETIAPWKLEGIDDAEQ